MAHTRGPSPLQRRAFERARFVRTWKRDAQSTASDDPQKSEEVLAMDESSNARIVVGVDGSPASKAALSWAVTEARLRHSTVEAVHAWQFPAIAVTHYGGEAVPVFARDDLEKAAEELLHDTVTEVTGDDGDVDVTAVLADGRPADALLTASEGADLLVVGSPGHGGVAGALLGSVSTHVLRHSRCPVVVIRG
jgi:nucleotide-binding universal stress UspA family protein